MTMRPLITFPLITFMALALAAALLAGAGGALLALRLVATGIAEPAPRLVTADLAGMTRAFTLETAMSGLDAAATERAVRSWTDALAARLEATARHNRLIIIPRTTGVFGAADITDQLGPLLPPAAAPHGASAPQGNSGTGEAAP